jgi:transposase
VPKEIHAILTQILGKHALSYATIKNWVAQFKHGDSSTCDAPCPGRPKTVTTTEISDQIHKLILEDHRISAKSISEKMRISQEKVGSIIHESLDMRKFSRKWIPKCLPVDKKRQWHKLFEELFKFFRYDPNNFLSKLVTMEENWLHHYKPELKQQSMGWWHSSSLCHNKF